MIKVLEPRAIRALARHLELEVLVAVDLERSEVAVGADAHRVSRRVALAFAGLGLDLVDVEGAPGEAGVGREVHRPPGDLDLPRRFGQHHRRARCVAGEELVLGGERFRRPHRLGVSLVGQVDVRRPQDTGRGAARREAHALDATRTGREGQPVDADVLGHACRPLGRAVEVLRHHECALGVPDGVDLVVTGLRHQIVEERVENGEVGRREGVAVDRGDHVRVVVARPPQRLRLVLLGRAGEAVHEHDRQRRLGSSAGRSRRDDEQAETDDEGSEHSFHDAIPT